MLFGAVVEHKTIKLWSIFKNRSDYVKMSRLLGLEEAKNTLDDKKISAALLESGVAKLADKSELLILHDGSDIRKQYSSKLEELGKVLDLDGSIINGYSSFNSVAVDLHSKEVTLLSSEVYSNRGEDFISQADLKFISKPLSKKATPEQRTRYEELKVKAEAREYYNSSLVMRQQLQKVSQSLKQANPEQSITHIIDRGGDDEALFDFINNDLNDKFVIRLKASRVSTKITGVSSKLVEKDFAFKSSKQYTKIQIKSKVYQDVTRIIEYGEQVNGYAVVRIRLLSREGVPLFKAPMLLITNKEVSTEELVGAIYHIYLQRSKIEGVFKFLKDVLGWEESQIRNFKAIKTVLTFCYFVAGYFYEIESELIENETIQFIAYLGNGKGKVTRHYILQGFSKMITKAEVDEAIERFGIIPEQLQRIMQLVMRGV